MGRTRTESLCVSCWSRGRRRHLPYSRRFWLPCSSHGRRPIERNDFWLIQVVLTNQDEQPQDKGLGTLEERPQSYEHHYETSSGLTRGRDSHRAPQVVLPLLAAAATTATRAGIGVSIGVTANRAWGSRATEGRRC